MKLKYRIGLIVMILLLLCTGIFATTISDSLTSFTGNVGIGTSTPSNELDIVNADADYGIFVDQNGATNDTSAGIGVDNTGNDGLGFKVYSDHSNTAHELVKFHVDNNGFDEEVVNIVNDGTGNGVLIDQNGNGIALNIDSESALVGVFNLDAQNTDGNVFAIVNHGNHADATNVLVSLYQEHASSIAGVQKIINEGTGNGLYIDQNGAGVGLFIDQDGAERGLYIESTGTITSGSYIYSNQGATQNDALSKFIVDNVAFDQPVISVQNDGTGNGLFIDQDGNGASLEIDSEATTSTAIILKAIPNNDVKFFTIQQGTTPKLELYRNDDVNEDVTLRLGTYHLWVDSTGDLRIKSTAPTSDTDGAVVGTQT